MSAVCPACGVAVVSGYAKCPKCGAALPVRKTQAPAKAGGTVAVDSGFPLKAIAVPVGIVVVVVVFAKLACSGSSEPEQSDAAIVQTQQPVAQPQQQLPPADRPFGGPVVTPTQPQGPDPTAASRELERALRGKRLWSTIEVSGARVDVRSAGCEDAQMVPTIATVAPLLRDAGLTRVRCVAQSGSVVFERDL